MTELDEESEKLLREGNYDERILAPQLLNNIMKKV
jgi:hypothetical protein